MRNNSHARNQAISINYDFIASMDGFTECRCISERTAQMLLPLLEMLHWKTRWVGEDIDQDTIDAWASQAEHELMSDSDCGLETNVTDIMAEDCVISIKRPDDIDWQELIDLAECVPEALPQTLIRWSSCGFEQSLNGGASYAGLKQVYPLDASCRADRFLAQNNSANLVLYNAAAAQKFALGIVTTQNEMDTRESKLLVRFGAGATNTRQMYFNGDGTIQIVNSVVAPTAKFEVYNDVSALDVVKFEGRTGQATGTAVLHLGVVNQESAGTDGDAIRLRGLNSVTATRAPGILKVDKHGRLLNSDKQQLQVLTDGVTPKVYKTASDQVATLLDMSGANYRSLVAFNAYKNGTAATPALKISVTAADEPAIAFNGQDPIPKQDIEGTAEGNQLLFDLVAALATVGLLNIVSVTLGENCCDEMALCKIYDFTVDPYNSDWNIIDGTWLDGFGYFPPSGDDAIRLNLIISPDAEITYIRIAGTNPSEAEAVGVQVTFDSGLVIDTTHSPTPTWFDAVDFDPDELTGNIAIEIFTDGENPCFLTEIEIHYRAAGGSPSGGVECDVE